MECHLLDTILVNAIISTCTCTCTQCTHVHVSFLLSENYGNIIHERVDTEWITNGLVNTYTIYSGL